MSLSGVIVFILTAGVLFNMVFSSKDDFIDSVKYYFTPDVWSVFKGEFHQDFVAQGKLFIWLALSCLAGYGADQFFA